MSSYRRYPAKARMTWTERLTVLLVFAAFVLFNVAVWQGWL